MIKIQIVSDLHLEFWEEKNKFNFIKPTAPNLALLGDICCCGSDEDFKIFMRFIMEILPLYEKIFMVPGNHEYYHNPNKKVKITDVNTVEGIEKRISTFFKETNPTKLYLLNNRAIIINQGKQNYMIVGTTLWTWIPENMRKKIENNMNDYNFIYEKPNQKITATYVANTHIKAVKYIQNKIKKAKELNCKVIVFTHHKPYISENYGLTENSYAYESDLAKLFNKNLVLWAYGHTHIADNRNINGTLLYSNPKGYKGQRTNYSAENYLKL